MPSDPQDEATFLRAKVNHELHRHGDHRVLLELHRELIRLRREIPAFRALSKAHLDVHGMEREKVLIIRRWSGAHEVAGMFHFGTERNSASVPLPGGRWRKVFDSADYCWRGPGAVVPEEVLSDGSISVPLCPLAFIVFLREDEAKD